jgi:hypothetical protein
MADKREQILARLAVVLGELVDARQFFRNEVNIPETGKNRIVLLDGDEYADEETVRPRQATRGSVFVATPEIFLLLGDKSAPGTMLNAASAELIAAVSSDAGLEALCHDGDIRFTRRTTGFAAGRTIEAEARFDFEFRYFARPAVA